ncbi:bifunctional riboflavin kinase/FAD synthetase [Halomonas cibimaris]|uniref:Riboflavin biosynthesis protein n=1 Tax=Halomonas cibimaris TaxID=657012 RepID=A0ABP7LRJ8_9GAMM
MATIGNFDGVHRGHQAILQQCREHAARLGAPLAVVVFEPQPREFFAGDQAPPRLTRLREKVRLLRRQGVDQVLCLPFNEALRSLTGREFIDRVLLAGLGVKHLVVGDDFRFGCDRQGDFALLESVGRECGFGVEHTRSFEIENQRVSSTRVRTLLASGNFCAAARLLGRPYSLDGRVVRDQQLGRTIGAPTANLPLLPRPLALRGVFAVVAEREDGARYAGVANVGFRPTVGGTKRPTLEVHLFDFDGDLYGRRMTVIPCARLRGEVKFADFQALKNQIARDQAAARRYLAATSLNTDSALPLASAPLEGQAALSDPFSLDSSSAGNAADANDG